MFQRICTALFVVGLLTTVGCGPDEATLKRRAEEQRVAAEQAARAERFARDADAAIDLFYQRQADAFDAACKQLVVDYGEDAPVEAARRAQDASLTTRQRLGALEIVQWVGAPSDALARILQDLAIHSDDREVCSKAAIVLSTVSKRTGQGY